MKPFEEKIKCLVVEPDKKPSIQVIDNTLEAKQELVGGLIEVVHLSDTADLICNDEGKLIGLPANRIVGNDVIAGTFLVVGCEWDNENFVKFTEEFDQTLSEQVEARQEYFIRALIEMI